MSQMSVVNVCVFSCYTQEFSTDNAHIMNNDMNICHEHCGEYYNTSGVNKFLFTFKVVISFPC